MPRALFAEVAFVLPLRQTFTYRIPERLAEDARPGAHVLAPFRGRPRRGFVVELAAETAKLVLKMSIPRRDPRIGAGSQRASRPRNACASSRWNRYLLPQLTPARAATPGAISDANARNPETTPLLKSKSRPATVPCTFAALTSARNSQMGIMAVAVRST